VAEQPEYTKADLETIMNNWKRYFDPVEGGTGNAPKFPMPNNWLFLMRYAHLMKDEEPGRKCKTHPEKNGFWWHL
jgi:uncharacterized protein YyaL (SSP411 family)